jgi:hypothetical protein
MVAGPHCGDVSVIRATYRAHAGIGSRALRVRPVLRQRNWKLETGNWKLETGNWKLETGNWKLETGNWKLETGNWKFWNTFEFSISGASETYRCNK